ncbi:hypothetical protein [Lentzea sp. CC55]|uniref:hypothetical protein n=1 Tax=Lentzea sp. CC55 TaxID=2884909 RepID=UPI001F456B6E|nr:hypothetical protein [Lentzea sp. CC55]MCG8927333.1 hypothetical protein [Lentzea sp. CC55]
MTVTEGATLARHHLPSLRTEVLLGRIDFSPVFDLVVDLPSLHSVYKTMDSRTIAKPLISK